MPVMKLHGCRPSADAVLERLHARRPSRSIVETIVARMRQCDSAVFFWTPGVDGRDALKRAAGMLPAHLACELWEDTRVWLLVWPVDQPETRSMVHPGHGGEVFTLLARATGTANNAMIKTTPNV